MARQCPRISADYLFFAVVRIKVYILKRSANAAARNFPQRRESGFRGIPSFTRWDSASSVTPREISDPIQSPGYAVVPTASSCVRAEAKQSGRLRTQGA